MVGRQRSELYATDVLQRAGTYQQRINRFLSKARKAVINIMASASLEDFGLLPDGRGRSLNVRDKGLRDSKVGFSLSRSVECLSSKQKRT